ncbi:MAG: hypothetical protein L0Z46_10030 [Nitrospiraceae bacterium]|nr:hypothetical protein [Nitrospiraceae bacterium]
MHHFSLRSHIKSWKRHHDLSQNEQPRSDAKDKTISLNVRLKPSESSAHPRATNYTNLGVAQEIVYLDFGFIEPTLLAAIAKTAKDGQTAPQGLDSVLVTRVAMDMDVLARLH